MGSYQLISTLLFRLGGVVNVSTPWDQQVMGPGSYLDWTGWSPVNDVISLSFVSAPVTLRSGEGQGRSRRCTQGRSFTEALVRDPESACSSNAAPEGNPLPPRAGPLDTVTLLTTNTDQAFTTCPPQLRSSVCIAARHGRCCHYFRSD